MSLVVLFLLRVSLYRHYVSVSFFFALLLKLSLCRDLVFLHLLVIVSQLFLSCFAFLWLFHVFITI